jgi:hypothetical protein
MKFALKAERKHVAILCDSSSEGPFFDDMRVSDNCNANTDSFTSRTSAGQDSVFTGSEYFKVREIEVFKITD